MNERLERSIRVEQEYKTVKEIKAELQNRLDDMSDNNSYSQAGRIEELNSILNWLGDNYYD